MTGAKVRERVPDWVACRADQIELVDSSPEQLRRRMLHGNIYPKERVTKALSNFFRTDNLNALRELALRFFSWPTRPTKNCWSTCAGTSRTWCGRSVSGPWSRSTRLRGPTPCSGGRPGWPFGSRASSTSSTSTPATPPAPVTARPSIS